MAGLISAVYAVGFVLILLTAVTAWRAAWTRRDPRHLDILFLVSAFALGPFSNHFGPRLSIFTTALYFAQPYLLLRLVRHFHDVPLGLRLSAAGLVLPATIVGLEWPRVTTAVNSTELAVLILELYVALSLSREAKRFSGVTAKRLVFAAAGTWMLASEVVIVLFASSAAALEYQTGLVVSTITTGLLFCYFLAFNTPRALRNDWQRTEQARYLSITADRGADERGALAAEDLNRAAARSVGHAVTLVALRDAPDAAPLVIRASSQIGLVGLEILPSDGLIGRVGASGRPGSGSPDECESELADRIRQLGSSVLAAPVATSVHTWGVVVVAQRRGSLFPDDDLRLLAQLARYAGTALDHAHLVHEARERDRREADRRLRDVESRMALMLESIKDYAMFVVDLDGRVVGWPTGAEHVFGFTAEQMTDEPAAALYDMTPPEFAELLSEAQRLGHAEQERTCRRRDGARFVGDTIVRPLAAEGDRISGFVVVTHDVTERRELEARVRQSQKMEAVGQLAGGIAHDFNNLLTAILGYARWIGESLPPGDARLHHVAEIEKAANRAAGLTRQLLAFSRRQMLEPTAINLSRLVTDLLPMLSPLLGEQVEIAHEPNPRLAAVLGDRSQVEQIVVNLAVNARDAMPGGGRLSIRTSSVWLDQSSTSGDLKAGPYVLLEVSDTGTGMDAATMQHIFEPFFTTKEVGRGTGLGLATVYGIVQQMAGAVRVQSAPGQGTTFRLYFPETRVAETAPSKPAPVEAGRGSETLLLVEDDESVRAFLSRTLERSGYRVIAAEHPTVALARAEAADVIDLVITDVVLPGGTGPELVKALERVRPGLRVLYISGYADAVMAQQHTVPKASHFLQKPFSAPELLDRIKQILA